MSFRASALVSLAILTAGIAVIAGSAGPAYCQGVWQEQDSGVSQDLGAVDFVDPMNGWAAGSDGTIVTTNDGGVTWTTQTTGTDADLYALTFVDSRNGWAAGAAGVILHTADAGETWVLQRSGERDESLGGIAFSSPDQGWVAGSAGQILTTSDGGSTWSPQALPEGTDYELSAITFAGAAAGHAVGGAGDAAGVVLGTTDGGVTWTRVETSLSTLLGVASAGPTSAWAVGESGQVLTSNGPAWSSFTATGAPSLNDVAPVSGSQAWAVGSRGGRGTVIMSADGGATWGEMASDSHRLASVDFVSGRGWAVGDAGTILHYDPAAPSSAATPAAPGVAPPVVGPSSPAASGPAASPEERKTNWPLVVGVVTLTMVAVGFVALKLTRRA